MVLLFIVLLVILVIIVLLFTVTSKIYFHLDSSNTDISINAFWLYPLVKSVIRLENDSFMIYVYFLGKQMLKKQLNKNGEAAHNKSLLKKVIITDISVDTQYGFNDPYITGLTYSTVNVLSQFFSVAALYQRPDFLAFKDYINLEISARLNIGLSLLKLV